MSRKSLWGQPELAEQESKKWKIPMGTASLTCTALIGWGTDCVQEARTLNKCIRVTPGGCEDEADPRHVEVLLHQTETKVSM